VRDDQVRRYARHILLPDVGGLGQTALMVAAAHLELRESEPTAELIAGSYLAAGGVGTIALGGADEAQLAIVGSHGPDTKLTTSNDGRPVVLAPRPSWWPAAAGDDQALAFWRGGIAAVRWMADVMNR
jgi:hypothetical protein